VVRSTKKDTPVLVGNAIKPIYCKIRRNLMDSHGASVGDFLRQKAQSAGSKEHAIMP
jgi:hypothetical protein